jgi:hypothetical protein
MHIEHLTREFRASNTKPERGIIDPDLLPDPPRSRSRKDAADLQRPKWRKQIKRVLNFHYGCPLPDDDAGREDFALLCHAAFAELLPAEIDNAVTKTGGLWADWIATPELTALIDDVTNRPLELNRKKIGVLLNLTQAVRMRDDVKAYDIWPIDISHKDWKRWKAETARERSARNRAKRKAEKPANPTAIAVDFLNRWLADGPLPVARIMRLAVGAGLQAPDANRRSYALRAACETLGIVRRKIGLAAGWSWELPATAKHAETPDFIEGAKIRSLHQETLIPSKGRKRVRPHLLSKCPNQTRPPISRRDREAAWQGGTLGSVPASQRAVPMRRRQETPVEMRIADGRTQRAFAFKLEDIVKFTTGLWSGYARGLAKPPELENQSSGAHQPTAEGRPVKALHFNPGASPNFWVRP